MEKEKIESQDVTMENTQDVTITSEPLTVEVVDEVETSGKKKKTYNEIINEKGDASFLLATKKTKDGKVVKACVYIPKEKVALLKEAKGWKIPDDSNQKIVLRGGLPFATMIIDDEGQYTGDVFVADYTTQSSRGRRLNEKTVEGIVDFLRIYGKLDEDSITIATDKNLTPIVDSYSNHKEYTIDDLLDL